MSTRTILTGALASAMLMLAGCGAMPHHAEVRTERRSTLVFPKGHAGAIVFIDGREAATLGRWTSPVPIPDGTHEVRVEKDGETIYARTVFIEDGTRKRITIDTKK